MSTVAQIATLAHGYTMADVDDIARWALNVSWRTQNLSWSDRYDAAWFGIAERLYRAGSPRPTRRDLLDAGLQALSATLDAEYRHHGIAKRSGQTAPHFAKYWLAVGGSDDFTDRIVERLALPQVLAELTDLDYETFAALAAHGSNQAAAAALGIKAQAFNARVSRARRRFAETWLDHETPPAPPDLTKTCKAGHPRDDTNGYSTGRQWVCRTCARASDRKRKAANTTEETRALATLAARARRAAATA